MLRPFIHRRDRMNRTGLGRSQWLEELQQELIVFGLNGDVVGMLSDCDLATEYLDTFLGSKIPLGPKFIQHGRPVFASSRTVFGCVSPMGHEYHAVSIIHKSPSCLKILGSPFGQQILRP